MNFTFRPLAEQVGAEIIGIDLRQPIGKSTMANLREVWLEHAILLFSGQNLNDDQQIAFSRRIGELELLNMSALQLDGKPEIYTATNLDPNDNILPLDNPIMQLNAANAKWHSDSSFKKVNQVFVINFFDCAYLHS